MNCFIFSVFFLLIVFSTNASVNVFLFWFSPSSKQYDYSTQRVAIDDAHLSESVLRSMTPIKNLVFDPALCYAAPPLPASSTVPHLLPSDYVLRHEVGPDYTWKMLADMDHEWATRAGQSFPWPATYYILCVKVCCSFIEWKSSLLSFNIGGFSIA